MKFLTSIRNVIHTEKLAVYKTIQYKIKVWQLRQVQYIYAVQI